MGHFTLPPPADPIPRDGVSGGGGAGTTTTPPPPPPAGGGGAAVLRCPLPSTAVPRRLFSCPPPSAARLASIRPQRICPHHPPLAPPPSPPPCKVSLWPPMTACLLLISLRPGDKDEEETRSPSYPDARRIIGRGTADDSMPFLFYCNPMRRRLGSPSYPTAPDAHRIIGRGIVDDTASYYWPWHRQRQHAFFIFIATQRRR